MYTKGVDLPVLFRLFHPLTLIISAPALLSEADTGYYFFSCPCVLPSVRPSVCLSVCPRRKV